MYLRHAVTVTAAAVASSAFQAEKLTSQGSDCATTHSWLIRNNSASQATAQPQCSFSQGNDAYAANWAAMNAAATNIAAGALGLITVVDQPAARVRLNITALVDEELEIEYIGVLDPTLHG